MKELYDKFNRMVMNSITNEYKPKRGQIHDF